MINLNFNSNKRNILKLKVEKTNQTLIILYYKNSFIKLSFIIKLTTTLRILNAPYNFDMLIINTK